MINPTYPTEKTRECWAINAGPGSPWMLFHIFHHNRNCEAILGQSYMDTLILTSLLVLMGISTNQQKKQNAWYLRLAMNCWAMNHLSIPLSCTTLCQYLLRAWYGLSRKGDSPKRNSSWGKQLLFEGWTSIDEPFVMVKATHMRYLISKYWVQPTIWAIPISIAIVKLASLVTCNQFTLEQSNLNQRRRDYNRF